jgi:hypothetical protein
MGTPRELLHTFPTDPEVIERADQREQLRVLVDSLELSNMGSPVSEPLVTGNGTLLSAGEHGGFKLETPGTVVRGVHPNSKVTRNVQVDADAVFQNLTFLDVQVSLTSATSTVIFDGCTFSWSKVSTDKNFVMLVAGTQVIFKGCTFRGGIGTSAVLDNPGILTDVQVIGCYDATGGGFGTSTNVGSF